MRRCSASARRLPARARSPAAEREGAPLREAECTVRVGGLALRFDGCDPSALPDAWAPFRHAGRAHARFRVLREPGRAPEGELLCDAGIWRAFRTANGIRIENYAPPRSGFRPLLQADLSADWRRGVIRVDPELVPEELARAPMATPFGELLALGLLARAGALYVHAAAALTEGRVDLFLGKSGAGKTTLSAIAEKHGATILSDDRTVLRVRNGTLWAYGTPFHGTGRRYAAIDAPVRTLLFLEKAPNVSITPLPHAESVARLVSLTFAEFWSHEQLARALRHCDDACSRVPPLVLRFRPDESALDAISRAAQP